MNKILSDRYVKIHVEDIFNDNDTLRYLGKHAVFNHTIAYGVIDCLLHDKTDFDGEEDTEWYTIISFGGSMWEEARKRLFNKVDKAAAVQFEMLAEEREKYKKMYYEYMHKAVDLERENFNLKCRIERMEESNGRNQRS